VKQTTVIEWIRAHRAEHGSMGATLEACKRAANYPSLLAETTRRAQIEVEEWRIHRQAQAKIRRALKATNDGLRRALR